MCIYRIFLNIFCNARVHTIYMNNSHFFSQKICMISRNWQWSSLIACEGDTKHFKTLWIQQAWAEVVTRETNVLIWLLLVYQRSRLRCATMNFQSSRRSCINLLLSVWQQYDGHNIDSFQKQYQYFVKMTESYLHFRWNATRAWLRRAPCWVMEGLA